MVCLSGSSYCQNCSPVEVRSSCLSYIQLPPAEALTHNYRFFYKLILECQGNPNTSYDEFRVNDTFPALYVPGLDALHVLDPDAPATIPYQPNGPMVLYNWQLDSIKKITGQVDPCVTLSSPPCYSVYYYHTDVSSPNVTHPMIASMVSCCRPFNSANIEFHPINWGNGCNYNTTPGAVGNGMINFIVVPALTKSPLNSSPVFTSNDTIMSTCIKYPFSYAIHVSDPDNDSIAYHFGTPRTFTLKLTPGFPPPRFRIVTMYNTFPQIQFKSGYSEQHPAGPTVKLDPRSGLLTGNLTDTGTFDITVCAVEYRGENCWIRLLRICI